MLYPNFTEKEFQCKCGCKFALKSGLKEIAQAIRDTRGKSVVITSPARCTNHNISVGGKSTSLHTKGEAMDISIANWSNQEILDAIRVATEKGATGIAINHAKNFIHVSKSSLREGFFRY